METENNYPPQLAGGWPAGTPAESRLALLERAWQRSRLYGVCEDSCNYVSGAKLSELIDQNRQLYKNALPVMETLYEQIANTHSMVVLTDANGMILHSLGDDDFLEKAERVALRPGFNWSERTKGTNAIGTAIEEQMPTLVHAREHYLHSNHFLTCSAAPVFSHEGRVLGVLDVTGDYRSYQTHTLALVRMSAQMIENQLFSAAFDNAITLRFHSRPEFIGTLMEGIVSFSPSGRFLAANRAALFQLGLPLPALQTHTFSSLFGLPLTELFDYYRSGNPGHLELVLHTGLRVLARAEMRLDSPLFRIMPEAGSPAQSAKMARPRKPHASSGPLGLGDLNTGDPQLAAAIAKVNKVLGHSIPILITGETGTGKDLFAQAIHQDSPVAAGPFVAVNCASIPETLIESELFGYEDGAFTGARKKGSPGKIVHANGGTLFLDEIGDMPMALQARLLRVLQERLVTPLGSTRSVPVNISLVCATNRNLREMIAQGRFREDLYYRINGLVVKLPPLRERTDLEAIVQRMLAAEPDGRRYTIAPDVLQLFRQHRWPGNLRQLSNLLRTAKIMTDDDGQIRREHLPDDFLEDAVTTAAVAMPSVPGASTLPAAVGGRLEEVELSLIRKTIDAHGGNVSAAARALGISRNTIYRRLGIGR